MNATQFTTPTFTLTFTEQELDLTQAQNVYVTFRCGGGFLTKTGADLQISEKQIDVILSQAETGGMSGNVEVQVNWTLPNGTRAASTIASVMIDRNLLKRVVE